MIILRLAHYIYIKKTEIKKKKRSESKRTFWKKHTLLRETKDSYCKQYLRGNKQFWRIINIKKKSGKSIFSLQIHGQTITSADKVFNHFNNFFAIVSEKINKYIIKSKRSHLFYLDPQNNSTIFLFSNSIRDIEDLTRSMKTKKASEVIQIVSKPNLLIL